MKNSIRCCISCILPCGVLDVIRIVHSNGYVEEISGSIKASDVMKAHPKHVLKKPSSPSSAAHDAATAPKIVIVPPEADLQRGKIYFLMPLPPTPPNPDKPRRRKKRDSNNNINHHSHRTTAAVSAAVPNNNNNISMTNLLVSDHYLSEILSDKASTHRERRRGRVGVWRPHLQSICESPSDI
ncbi:uncharacterized protein LOC120083324 [Benincasa hispida]|uniref:uncharacterized protein LOC120083324 n=1 Tax=Benincasa hispida TaxID=102211 RepID=UPI0018FF2768|nr:uncharacterized protein LOC120083324 [Benincasa hispida]